MYSKLGVSADKGGVRRAVSRLDAGLVPGAFCRIVPSLDGDASRATVMHADGVGTKAALALRHWRLAGNPDVWRWLAQDAVAMNLNDMACVGAVDRIAFTCTINRNTRVVTDDVVAHLIDGVDTVLRRLSDSGVTVWNSGGETADVPSLVTGLTVDASACALIDRESVIDNSRVKAGDVIVGISSIAGGRGSGIGCNGLTLAAHQLLTDSSAAADIEPLLTPTPLLTPLVARLTHRLPGRINGMAHITGGGLTKLLHCFVNHRIVIDSPMPVPPIFSRIADTLNRDWRQMYAVFNMGQLMAVAVNPVDAQIVKDIAGQAGFDARFIGRIADAGQSARALDVATPAGVVTYTL